MTSGISLTAAAALIVPDRRVCMSMESTSATTTYHRTMVDGVGVFYREAGRRAAPLHGFPSSSREFDTLIPLLAPRYHLIAPDFPGFGQSDAPPPSAYAYTFDNLARTINGLLEQLKIDKYTFYLHDYGGPVGFRIMSAHPRRLQALVIQNANAYKEGLGAKWTGIMQYWADPKAHPEVFDAFVSFPATEQRHTLGTSRLERYNPDTWTDEHAHLSKPGQREIQAHLLFDYRTNVASYRAWQAWLRQHRPPTLVVWGRNDPSFVAAGAHAFKRDLPDSEIHLLDAGHFALDERNDEIARLILEFLATHSTDRPTGHSVCSGATSGGPPSDNDLCQMGDGEFGRSKSTSTGGCSIREETQMTSFKYTLEGAPFNERPCPNCRALMDLAIIQPGRPGFDLRTFECPKCQHVETVVAEL